MGAGVSALICAHAGSYPTSAYERPGAHICAGVWGYICAPRHKRQRAPGSSLNYGTTRPMHLVSFCLPARTPLRCWRIVTQPGDGERHDSQTKQSSRVLGKACSQGCAAAAVGEAPRTGSTACPAARTSAGRGNGTPGTRTGPSGGTRAANDGAGVRAVLGEPGIAKDGAGRRRGDLYDAGRY